MPGSGVVASEERRYERGSAAGMRERMWVRRVRWRVWSAVVERVV